MPILEKDALITCDACGVSIGILPRGVCVDRWGKGWCATHSEYGQPTVMSFHFGNGKRFHLPLDDGSNLPRLPEDLEILAPPASRWEILLQED